MVEGSGTSASVESETEPTSDEPTPGPSLLATLLCPHPAAIARKRKVTVNPGPPRGKRRSQGVATSISSPSPLLANSFGDQQNNALQDYVETSIMLQYNKH